MILVTNLSHQTKRIKRGPHNKIMCGVCGVITNNKIDKKYANVLKSLLIANSERGTDSTGIAGVNGKAEIYKEVLPAIDFIDALPDLSKYHSVMGHTRFGTMGAVTRDNAHPFRSGHIVGVHNGIISNWREILSTARVDSQAIFRSLFESEDIDTALQRLKGSFALSWVNEKDTTKAYLLRHDNPMTVAIVDGAILYSSEYYHLLSHVATRFKNYKVFELKEDTLYTIDIPTLSIDKRKIDGLEKPITYGGRNIEHIYGGWNREDDQDLDELMGSALTYKEKQQLFDYVMMSDGCQMCGSFVESGYMIDSFTGEPDILCQYCITDEEKNAGEYYEITDGFNIDDFTPEGGEDL